MFERRYFNPPKAVPTHYYLSIFDEAKFYSGEYISNAVKIRINIADESYNKQILKTLIN